MTLLDAASCDRSAQRLVVEVAHGSGSPPTFGPWLSLWNAQADRIEINAGGKFSTARILFPDTRWHTRFPFAVNGDAVRVRTNEPIAAQRSVVFQGFITGHSASFSGGMGPAEGLSAAHEVNSLLAADNRWQISVTSLVFGMYARSPDDYDDYGEDTEAPIDDKCKFFSGRRTIFNEDGKPNMDATPVTLDDCITPIFAPQHKGAELWTVADMVRHILAPLYNNGWSYTAIGDPADLIGLDHHDFTGVLNHICIDGLNVIEALELICRHVGWSFREEYSIASMPTFIFFKQGSASGFVRSAGTPTIMHYLHAPAVGEQIVSAVAARSKMLWSMAIDESITPVVNAPFGLGAPDRLEFTAELVPAWDDKYLVPDTSDDLANLYFTDADLQTIADPNAKSYYRKHHIRGSSFDRAIARQWLLNESGRYSPDRGHPFDFRNVMGSKTYAAFAPFKRRLLPALTYDNYSLNTVGIKVEFSFDGGVTWRLLPCSISSLPDECGIHIDEPNLCEMVDESGGLIDGGPLDGVQLNYWTSLADDKLNAREFKDGEWRTRCRITASVDLDRRLTRYVSPLSPRFSPFNQVKLYDFSDKYGIRERSLSSVHCSGPLSADETDSTYRIDRHLTAIRQAYQDASISGLFVLERLWCGDGAGWPTFLVGDGIEGITGRAYSLSIRTTARVAYPEIIQITYLGDQQKTQLITRDLRFAEVTVQ